MKLFSHIMLNVLFSTVVFSAFAGPKWDKCIAIRDNVLNYKKEIGISAGSAAAGALLMYLASNEKVKACAGKATTAVSNYTKAKYQALVNYWNNLSKGKKIGAGAAAGASVAAAAYIYFDGPGVDYAKGKVGLKP